MQIKLKTFASIGLGWVAREIWLPIFYKYFKMVGALDPDEKAVANAKISFPDIPIQDSMEDIIRLKPDIALIAVPNEDHVPIAAALLKNGISVLIEKPVCTTLSDFYQLQTIAQESCAHVFPSRASCQRSDILKMEQIIKGGELGEIRRTDLEWIRSSGIPRPGGWFTNREKSGGGVMIDLGWHLMDVGAHLLSFPKIKTVLGTCSSDFLKANTNTASWRYDQEDGNMSVVDVEDAATLFMKTTSGIGIKLETAWASHNPIDVTRIVLSGTKGKLALKTTFGFSPNRVSIPTLNLWKNGSPIALELEKESFMAPYDRQVRQILQRLEKPVNNTEQLKGIALIVQAIDTFYSSFETSTEPT